MALGLLGWAVIFLVIALIAALFGFGTIVGTSIAIAKWIFYIFIILFVVTLILHLIRS